MKTRLKTSPENKLENLLKNKNFRNNQNYIINREIGYKIVRKYDFGIWKIIIIGIFTFFIWNIVFIVLLIIIFLFLLFINSFYEGILESVFSNGISFYFIYLLSIFTTVYNLNKFGQKRFNVLLINPNKNNIYNILKDKNIILANIGYLLIKK